MKTYELIARKTIPHFVFSAPIFGSDYVSKVVPLLDAAKYEISIVVFVWCGVDNARPSKIALFNDAIFRAIKRGVRVRAIVSSVGMQAVLQKHGVEAKVIPTSRLLHTKLLITDRTNIVLGSHNFTHNAFCSNLEVSVYLSETDAENEFITYFEHLWLS